MRLSFTGTQAGMTKKQHEQLSAFMREQDPLLLIHGACIGADDEADKLACLYRMSRLAFPATIKSKRIPDSVLQQRGPISIMPEAPALKRNKSIIWAGDILIACPKEPKEVLRSGTWSCIRYAQTLKDWDIRIFLPY